MPTFDSDKAMTVLGVPGRLTHRTTKPDQKPGTWLNQRWVSTGRPIKGYGEPATLTVELRFDDECRNGHNTFAITGTVKANRQSRRRDDNYLAGGCLHEDITRVFPELSGLIAWHLCSSDGPMHYVANTIYHASNRDHHGCLKGEPWAWDTAVQFGSNPIRHKLKSGAFAKFLQENARGIEGAFDFEVLPVEHRDRGHTGKYQFGPKYTFGGFGKDWHECPFESEDEALRFLAALQRCEPKFVKVATAWGEGKARELEAARRSAVWPEASDEMLSADPATLRAYLEARLPDLIARFRADMERVGFVWAPEEMVAA